MPSLEFPMTISWVKVAIAFSGSADWDRFNAAYCLIEKGFMEDNCSGAAWESEIVALAPDEGALFVVAVAEADVEGTGCTLALGFAVGPADEMGFADDGVVGLELATGAVLSLSLFLGVGSMLRLLRSIGGCQPDFDVWALAEGFDSDFAFPGLAAKAIGVRNETITMPTAANLLAGLFPLVCLESGIPCVSWSE